MLTNCLEQLNIQYRAIAKKQDGKRLEVAKLQAEIAQLEVEKVDVVNQITSRQNFDALDKATGNNTNELDLLLAKKSKKIN